MNELEKLKPGRKIEKHVTEERRKLNESDRERYEKNKKTARQYKTELMRKYRASNPEKYRCQSRNAKAKLRERLFNLYGHECAICGFSDKRALTLDHIKQNGNQERKQFGERGVYVRAANNYLPEEYRTLCMNCQFIQRSI